METGRSSEVLLHLLYATTGYDICKGPAHLFSVCSNSNPVFFCRISVLEKARCTLIWSTGPLRINFRRNIVSPLKSAPFSVGKRKELFHVLSYLQNGEKQRTQSYSKCLTAKFLTKEIMLLHQIFCRM